MVPTYNKLLVAASSAVLIVATSTSVHAAITKLAAVDKAALLNQKFDITTSTSAIPKCVRDAFAEAVGATKFDMADPGQRFDTADYSGQKLPYYKLVFAGVSADHYVIEALRGGASTPSSVVFLFTIQSAAKKDSPFVIHQVHGDVPHTSGALVFDSTPTSAKLVWTAQEGKAAGDLDGERNEVVDNKMDETTVQTDPNLPRDPGMSAPASPMPTLTRSW